MDGASYTVDGGLVWGRPGPETMRWDLPAMRARGLGAIVSLVRIPDPESVRAAGLRHYLHPFEEKLRLPYKTANGFLMEILGAFDHVLDEHLPRREPVLVHCMGGRDRTGLLLTYYLVTRCNVSVKRAVQDIRKRKTDALTANGYEDMLHALEPEMKR